MEKDLFDLVVYHTYFLNVKVAVRRALLRTTFIVSLSPRQEMSKLQ